MAKQAKKLSPVRSLEVVTELELIAIETLRIQIAEAMKTVREAKGSLEQRELAVILKLQAGVPVQGKRSAMNPANDRTGPAPVEGRVPLALRGRARRGPGGH